jgi:hypothetical protein
MTERIEFRSGGYRSAPLNWNGKVATWGNLSIHMALGGLDKPPLGVKEVRLLEPTTDKDKWMDGAKITISPGGITPVQRFAGVRSYVEEPINGRGAWIGVTPDGESYCYDPATTYSLKTHRREGSLVYGPGWIQCWVNMGSDDFQYTELCFPKFEDDGTSEVVYENQDVSAPMYWRIWRMLLVDSLEG